jgi:hypothetical protein
MGLMAGGAALTGAAAVGGALAATNPLPFLAAAHLVNHQRPDPEEPNKDVPNLEMYTPEYVEANRDELGIPPGAPIEDFFTEFIAHQVTGGEGRRSDHCQEMLDLEQMEQDGAPLSLEALRELKMWKQEKALIEAWGYDPIITEDQEVEDTETGLYGLRYNATDKGRDAGRGDIASFRGTQPGEKQTGGWFHDMFCDVWSDTRQTVGENQFRDNEAAIGALLDRGSKADGTDGVSTVTGHSLGGFLAQHAGASFTDLIDNVVTFQAGGISEEEIAKFNENNADGNTDVRHHYAGNTDFVHMAGEERLGGTFFDYSSNDWDFGHLKGLMFGGTEGEEGVLQKLGGISHVTESNTDTVDPRMRHIAEAGRSGAGIVGDLIGVPAWALSSFSEESTKTRHNASQNIQKVGNRASQGIDDTWTHAIEATQDTGNALAEFDLLGAAGAGLGGMGHVASDVFNTHVDFAGGMLRTGAEIVRDDVSAIGTGANVGLETLHIAGEQGYNTVEELVELGVESTPILNEIVPT